MDLANSVGPSFPLLGRRLSFHLSVERWEYAQLHCSFRRTPRIPGKMKYPYGQHSTAKCTTNELPWICTYNLHIYQLLHYSIPTRYF